MKEKGYQNQLKFQKNSNAFLNSHHPQDNSYNANSYFFKQNIRMDIQNEDICDYAKKSIEIKQPHENQAENYLKQISEDHWIFQNLHQNKLDSSSYHQNYGSNTHTISFKQKKSQKNYLTFNKTCTLKPRHNIIQKHAYFQLSQKQRDKSQRYKQRDAQTSMYFYQSLNLKDTIENVQQQETFFKQFKKEQQKTQNIQSFVNMKQNLKSKSEYYEKLKYHLFKTFQIDGKPLLINQGQNSNKKIKNTYTIDNTQFVTESPSLNTYFNKAGNAHPERRKVYSSKKKISMDLLTLDNPYPISYKANNTSIHTHLNRSKQLKLMEQEQYHYLLSKKDKKRKSSYNQKVQKHHKIQNDSNENNVNLNKGDSYFHNQKHSFNNKSLQKKINFKNSKQNKINNDLTIISKWDRANMRGKLWLGRPPVKIIQKMIQQKGQA